ncbi:MAG: SH3 domain-containing protein, partial [Chloroflexota bacterium]
LAGCKPSAEEEIALAYTAAAETAAVQATNAPPTETPLPTATPLPTPTATPAWVTTAFVVNGPLNLRYGPGTFFESMGSLENGTKLYVLASIPGGEWFEVLAPNPNGNGQIVGWLNSSYLQISSYLGTIPIGVWPQEMTIYGSVTDENGVPINAVRVAAVYTQGDTEIRADTPTNEIGEFAIYLPQRISGPFDVQITAVNCNSRISVLLEDGECEIQEYFPVVWRSTEFIPMSQAVHFYYEKAATSLTGKISYADGWGYPGILIKATRLEDNIDSEAVSPSNGRFFIPLGFGTWEVVAIRFERDGTPFFSQRVTYTITEEGQELEPFNVIIDDIYLNE